MQQKFSNEALKEMEEDHHPINLLNGEADLARQYVSEARIKTEEAKNNLQRSKNTTLVMRWDKIDDKNIKDLLCHMPEQARIKFLDSDEVARRPITEAVVSYLEKIREARANQKILNDLITKAQILVKQAEQLVGKKDIDTGALAKVLETLKTEIENEHPDKKKIESLYAGVQNEIDQAIGSEKKLVAQNDGNQLIEMINEKMKAVSPEDAEIKKFFDERIKLIEKTIESGDIFALKALIEETGKDLVEKTDPSIRSKKVAINSETKVMLRFILKRFFGLEQDESFDTINDRIAEVVESNYRLYYSKLGKFGLRGNTRLNFKKIEVASLKMIFEEVIMVHNGLDTLKDASIVAGVSLSEIDKEYTNLQKWLNLSTTDMNEDEKTISAIKNALTDIKDQITSHFRKYAGLSPSEIKVLKDGPLFELALRMVPEVALAGFSEETQ